MFCCNWLKLKITVQPVMQKARVVKPPNVALLTAMRAVWESQSSGLLLDV